MLKLLLLLSCWLVATDNICQTPPATFPDAPTITETSVGKTRIGMSNARVKELYKGFTFTPTYTAAYGFDGGGGKPDAILVSKAGQKLFVYFLDEATKKVYGLIVLNPAYKTA